MATYLELCDLKNNSDLQDKVKAACIIAANNIRIDASPPANQTQRLAWAASTMMNPKTEAIRMLWAVLAANKDATVSAILNASDSAIQSNVEDAIDLFAGS